MDNKAIIEILTKWGEVVVADTKEAIDSKITHGGGQTTDLSGSVNYKVLNSNGVITFQLTMNKYWYWLNYGRQPNKKPPPTKPLKEWLKKKGISQAKADKILLNVNIKHKGQGKKLGGIKITKRTLKTVPFEKKLERISWLFAKSIGKKGYKGEHFMDDIVSSHRIDELKSLLAPVIKQQFLIDIKNELAA